MVSAWMSSNWAQTAKWPSKTIRIVVAFPPGGLTDALARSYGEHLSGKLGVPVVVDNKPGAGAIIGIDTVAKAPADGHTFVTVIGAHAANATLYAGRLPYDPVKSFAPVSLVGIAPLVMTVNNQLPVKNVKELIDYAKANPGKLAFGSSGVGAAAHLTQELFKQVAGIDLVHVPYKGTAPALADLMGGNIQILTDTASAMMPHVRGGKIKGMTVFSNTRVPGAPEVPTITESGGPAIEGSTWVLFLTQSAVSKDIVRRMSAETAKALNSPDIKAKFEALGIITGDPSPEFAAKFLDEEIVKWAKVISTAGVKAE